MELKYWTSGCGMVKFPATECVTVCVFHLSSTSSSDQQAFVGVFCSRAAASRRQKKSSPYSALCSPSWDCCVSWCWLVSTCSDWERAKRSKNDNGKKRQRMFITGFLWPRRELDFSVMSTGMRHESRWENTLPCCERFHREREKWKCCVGNFFRPPIISNHSTLNYSNRNLFSATITIN